MTARGRLRSEIRRGLLGAQPLWSGVLVCFDGRRCRRKRYSRSEQGSDGHQRLDSQPNSVTGTGERRLGWIPQDRIPPARVQLSHRMSWVPNDPKRAPGPSTLNGAFGPRRSEQVHRCFTFSPWSHRWFGAGLSLSSNYLS